MESTIGTVVDPVQAKSFPARISWHEGRLVAVESVPESEVLGKPFILPGFIDAHVHVESSMLPPGEFARMAFAQGTLASVSDPHEIANVLGVPGVEFMLNEAAHSPFKFCFGAPSCVPATAYETSGAVLGAAEVGTLLERPDIGYLAEVMNYPGVIANDPDLLEKIRLAHALGKPVDGHSPGLRGEGLARYISAGISTDHECSTLEEALEKRARGMKILIREGSAARNFDSLLPLLSEHSEYCMFCSDDKHPDALEAGHINQLVARAIKSGNNLFDVLRVACVNPVRHYNLPIGLLQPGDPADFIIVENLRDFRVQSAWIRGKCAARDGASTLEKRQTEEPNQFHARKLNESDFSVPRRGKILRVIEVQDGQLITHSALHPALLANGETISDTEHDILKMAVVNRYKPAPPAMGFVRNIGLRRGAIASTVAHDSHNIVAVGTNDRDLCRAVNALMDARGGCVAVDGDTIELLPLPIAGLMSNESGGDVARRYAHLTQLARTMGSTLEAPFMTLSFLALLVIPELKLSDKGLFDGRAFEFVPVFADK